MENFGLTMLGNQFVQKVANLPDWDLTRFGQLIYSQENQQCWLGGDTLDDGINGWIPIGILNRSIKKFNISWDDDLSTYDTDNVAASSIPCLYGNNDPPNDDIPIGMPVEETINIQEAIDRLLIKVIGIVSGFSLEDGCIKPRHMGFKANEFLILNQSSIFTGPLATVESALNELAVRTASDWDLDTTRPFGYLLGLNTPTPLLDIQSALLGLELYLSNIKAVDISAIYPVTNAEIDVQTYLNSLFLAIDDISFLDLKDTPNVYGLLNQVIITTGSSLEWKTLEAIDIICSYPGVTISNVQAALWMIQGEISSIRSDLLNIKHNASDIIYDHATLVDVDDALDYLLAHSYMPSNPPNAVVVISSGIGGTINVQEALEYLQTQVNQLIGMIPCDIWASDVHYNAPSGHTDVQGTLDYLYTTISAMKIDISNKSDINHTHDYYYTKYEIDKFIKCVTNDLVLRQFITPTVVKVLAPITILTFGTFQSTIAHKLLVTASFEILNHLIADCCIVIDLYKTKRTDDCETLILLKSKDYCISSNSYCERKYKIETEDFIGCGEYDYFVQIRTDSTNFFYVKDSTIVIAQSNTDCDCFIISGSGGSGGTGGTCLDSEIPCGNTVGPIGQTGCTGGPPDTDPGFDPCWLCTGGTGGIGESGESGKPLLDFTNISMEINLVDSLQIMNVTVTIDVDGTRNYSFVLKYNIIGSGSIIGAQNNSVHDYGDIVNLKAIPDVGQQFSHWSGSNIGNTNPLQIIMDSNITITANFSASPVRFTLTTHIINGNDNCSIVIFPEEDSYFPDTEVILTACPGICTFDKWEIDATGNDLSITVKMTKNMIIDAKFICPEPIERILLKDNNIDVENISIDSNNEIYTLFPESNIIATNIIMTLKEII